MQTNNKNKSRFTKNFIISIAVLYSLLILINMISWFFITNHNNSTIRTYLLKLHKINAINKAEKALLALKNSGITERSELIKRILSERFRDQGNFLNIIIYKKTSDDNYFKVTGFTQNTKMQLPLTIKTVVKEKGIINYLKEATFRTVADPHIHTSDTYSWFNVYSPFYAGNKKYPYYIIQFMVSATESHYLYKNFKAAMANLKTVNIITTIILILGVLVLTAVFIHNFSLLIRNLSHHLNRAATGDHSISLNAANDPDLNNLALSFNKLVDGLKNMQVTKVPDATGIHSDLFNRAVAYLKENDLENAIAIFTTLRILRPDSFANFFNLGVAYAKQKNFERSLIMFEKAIALNQNHETAKKYLEKVRRILSAKMKTLLNKDENK